MMEDPIIFVSPSPFLQDNRNNYYHFIFDIFFPLYVYLKDRELLDKDPQLVLEHKCPFDDIFKLLTARKLQYSSGKKLSGKKIHTEGHMTFNEDRMYLGSNLIVDPPEKLKSKGYSIEEAKSILQCFQGYVLENLGEKQELRNNQVTIIKRKKSRVIANHKELVSRLKKEGLCVFEIYLEELSFSEQVKLMQNTSVLVGAHGSGLVNSLFLPPGRSIIELNPFGWKLEMYKNLASIVNCKFFQLSGEYDNDLYLGKETRDIREQKNKVDKITYENSPLNSNYELRNYVREQNIRLNIDESIALVRQAM